ncbi:hypothetical protein B0O80DRAFT_503425 [Mortierella sp. GBAus27b]|nr:hypothetical protein B0O80DRAFT_503425 [Mortierella sp. GBAus27b]
MRHRDRILKPFVQQFRSYILCEYGDHTTSENSNTQFEIHLVKHEGYDLDKPTEFFEKYGPYVLTQMYMDKYQEDDFDDLEAGPNQMEFDNLEV